MTESIFRAAWWPIHVAVAWAVTRDRAFVERSNLVRSLKSLSSIQTRLDLEKMRAEAGGRTPAKHHFEGADDAWSALREEMATPPALSSPNSAGKVRTFGMPFERRSLRGNTIETNEMGRKIAAVEIATMRLQDDDCLVPEDWQGSIWGNLRGYRNVRVFRDDVLRAFKTKSRPTGLIEGLTPATTPMRYPGDAALIEEGRRMLETGMEKRAVARKLAPRAEGAGTLESKIDRLRRAL
jgi:hypothetical protein